MSADVLVRTHSHRARRRLQILLGSLPPSYNSWLRGGGYFWLPEAALAAALQIKGVRKAQDPGDLFQAWTREDMGWGE
jgi:hypothetical protein